MYFYALAEPEILDTFVHITFSILISFSILRNHEIVKIHAVTNNATMLKCNNSIILWDWPLNSVHYGTLGWNFPSIMVWKIVTLWNCYKGADNGGTLFLCRFSCRIKGTVAWDFWTLVFCINRQYLGLRAIYSNIFENIFVFTEIFTKIFLTSG